MVFARGFLLKCRCGEGRGGKAGDFLGLDVEDGEIESDEAAQKGFGLLGVLPFLFKDRFEDTARFQLEQGLDTVVQFFLEGQDFALPVHDQAQGDRLHAAGRQSAAHLSPQHGREFESDQTVQYAAGLLGIHEVHIDIAGCLERVQYGVLGDFVEDDAAGVFFLQSQGLEKMPGDGFSFPVFIRRQIDGRGIRRQLFQFADHRFFVGGNDIFRLKTVLDVHAQIFL